MTGILHALAHTVVPATLEGKCLCYHDFTDRETEANWGSKLSQVIDPTSGSLAFAYRWSDFIYVFVYLI